MEKFCESQLDLSFWSLLLTLVLSPTVFKEKLCTSSARVNTSVWFSGRISVSDVEPTCFRQENLTKSSSDALQLENLVLNYYLAGRVDWREHPIPDNFLVRNWDLVTFLAFLAARETSVCHRDMDFRPSDLSFA